MLEFAAEGIDDLDQLRLRVQQLADDAQNVLLKLRGLAHQRLERLGTVDEVRFRFHLDVLVSARIAVETGERPRGSVARPVVGSWRTTLIRLVAVECLEWRCKRQRLIESRELDRSVG